jgi:heat shock protein HslJ
MTDDQMNARLRDAGERWRGANTATAEGDAEELLFTPTKQSHHRRWLTLASAAVIAAALVIGGVVWATQQHHASAPPATKVKVPNAISVLEGVTWTDTAANATVVFLDGAARTFDGCSNGVNELTVHGDELSLGKQIGPASTCTGTPQFPGQKATPQERALHEFYKTLRGPSTWSLNGQTLSISRATGASITLTTDGTPALAVVDESWTLERVTDATANELDGSFSAASLAFDRRGGFTASDLCNQISGTATATVDSIDFSTVAMTARSCGGASPATDVIDKVLSGNVRYAIRGDELILSKVGYDGLLIYLPLSRPSNDRTPPLELIGQTWNLTSVQFGDDVFAQPRKPVVQSHLTFLGSSYEATHRCYTRTGASTIGDGSMTLTGSRAIDTIPCPQIPDSSLNAADGQESQAVDAILDGTVQWSQRNDTLTLHKDGAGTLVYISTGTGTSTAAAKFSGAIWRLVTIESGTTATTPSGRVFLQRLAGTIAVSGCASPGIGFIKLSNGRLSVSDFRYSSPCQNPLLSSADRAALRTILSGKLTWSITGNQLTITKHGVGSLGLVRK